MLMHKAKEKNCSWVALKSCCMHKLYKEVGKYDRDNMCDPKVGKYEVQSAYVYVVLRKSNVSRI